MTTTLTLAYEGPPSCRDCQRDGIPVCDHIGFTAEAWNYLMGQQVHAPGLDPRHEHTLTDLGVSEDRKVVTLTVSTDRPPYADLSRHLSVMGGAKTFVRAVHHDTDDVIEEGRYDFFLRAGDTVYHGTDEYLVQSIEHPARDPVTGIATGPDVQVARLAPVSTEPIRPAT